jgi:hypothetical protein
LCRHLANPSQGTHPSYWLRLRTRLRFVTRRCFGWLWNAYWRLWRWLGRWLLTVLQIAVGVLLCDDEKLVGDLDIRYAQIYRVP